MGCFLCNKNKEQMKKQVLIILLALIGAKNQAQTVPTNLTAKADKSELFLNKRSEAKSGFKTNLDPTLKPFYHGVASGDPLSDGVIIWTRVTPDSAMTVQGTWKVCSDTSLTNTITQGNFTTDASVDYTVKIDVTGLSPNTTYYYYFSALNANSLIGRTRTAPTAAMVDHLKFGVVSCSNFEAGYFNAYARLGERNDLDAVIHLGDYIYEYASGIYGDSLIQASGGRVHDTIEAVSLEQYRTRHSLYHLDADLRRAHQQHPFINIWDDHESANDAWENGAENHDPATEGNWNDRKNVAKQAFFEWIPIRNNINDTIHRILHYGDLVDVILLDTRLEAREQQINDVTDSALYSPTRTMLGNTQLNWFLGAMDNSTAQWKIVGNQVIFSEFHVGWAAQSPSTPDQTESIFLDIWDGYPAERLTIINYLENNGIDDVIFLTGDFHSTFAFDVADSVTDPAAFYAPTSNYDPSTGAGSVAVEFVTPSISSANFDENVGAATAAGFEYQINNPLPGTTANIPNPHMKFADLDRHGYFILDVKSDSAQANWYYVDILDTLSTTENFGEAWYSKTGENHLNQSTVESSPKPTQEVPAPLTPPTINIAEVIEVTNNVSVLGIYPNPVTNYFTIHFGLNQAGLIKIDMMDVHGQIVKEIINKSLPQGIYNLNVETNEHSSGVYFLKFNSVAGESTHKVIVGK